MSWPIDYPQDPTSAADTARTDYAADKAAYVSRLDNLIDLARIIAQNPVQLRNINGGTSNTVDPSFSVIDSDEIVITPMAAADADGVAGFNPKLTLMVLASVDAGTGKLRVTYTSGDTGSGTEVTVTETSPTLKVVKGPSIAVTELIHLAFDLEGNVDNGANTLTVSADGIQFGWSE